MLPFNFEASEALPRSVGLWVKWGTNCRSLVVYLFRDADRDFSLVIFQIPEPVCEPRLLVGIVQSSGSYLKLFYFSHPYV